MLTKIKSRIRYSKVHSNLDFRTDDVFLVSYAKSGNTWLRFLIGNLIYAQEGGVNFGNFNTIMPDIYRTSKDSIHQMKRQRFIKSHEHFNTSYPKVIYIQRNPKHVVTSYYTWYRNSNPSLKISFDDFFIKFINGSTWNGCWKAHSINWINGAIERPDRIHVLKYEELVADTYFELSKILKFLDLSFKEEEVKLAIKKSSIEHMKKDEEKYPNSIFDNAASRFVGNEKYKEKLSAEHEATIERIYGIY